MTTVAQPTRVGAPTRRPRTVRARATEALVGRLLDSLPVRAVYPDGTQRGGGGPESPGLELVRPAAVFDRMGRNPKIGLGEAYMAGDWRAAEGTDLGVLLTAFATRIADPVPRPMLKLRAVVDQRIPRHHRNTMDGARGNISVHYDLSNDLFATFLDPTLSYSSAMFAGSPPFSGQCLEEAQRRKTDAALDLAGVTAGSRVLEIGTGWGSLAIAAAQRGADVTTVTISQEQLDLARKRVAHAGLVDRIDLRLQDYREVEGSFDSIVSVEMIEAVGEEFWPVYFGTLDRLLAPGGKIALQAIVMEHARMTATRNSFGWIQKYIFPGGLIPSVPAITAALTEHTGLRAVQRHHFGVHYAETLRRWRARFDREWRAGRTAGFDETFRRMWEFYLAYCEAGFESGYLDVAQLQLSRRPT